MKTFAKYNTLDIDSLAQRGGGEIGQRNGLAMAHRLRCLAATHPGDNNSRSCAVWLTPSGYPGAICQTHNCAKDDIIEGANRLLGIDTSARIAVIEPIYPCQNTMHVQSWEGRYRRSDGVGWIVNHRYGTKGFYREPSGTGIRTYPGIYPYMSDFESSLESALAEGKPPKLVVCEGEKDASAIHAAGFVAVSWLGGSSGVEYVDFRPVVQACENNGCEAILWPDNDDPGIRAMSIVARILSDQGISLSQVDYLDLPHKAGAHDTVRDNLIYRVNHSHPLDVTQIADTPDLDIITELDNADESEDVKLEIYPYSPSLKIRTGFAVRNNASGLVKIMDALRLQVRFNKRAESLEARIDDPDRLGASDIGEEWSQLTTPVLDWLHSLIAEHFYFMSDNDKIKPAKFVRADMQAYISAMGHERQADPFAEWLDTLPEWDGSARIDRIFVDLLGADDTEINREAARRWMIGLVARTRHPGCEHDWLPVLIGPQGCGKGSLVQGIVPPSKRGIWSRDEVDLALTTKEKVESIGSAIVVEFAEMTGLHGIALARLKTYLSRREDAYRPSYGRFGIVHKRHWAAIGTANPTGERILPTDVANRRFLAVRVGIGIEDNSVAARDMAQGVREYMESNREQLWAEAVHAYDTAELEYPSAYRELPSDDLTSIHLIPNALLDAQNEVNKLYDAHEYQSLDGESITDMFVGKGSIHITDIMVAAGISESVGSALVDKSSQMRLGGVLTRHQWTKRRERVMVNGKAKQQMMWQPPVRKKEDPITEDCYACKSLQRRGHDTKCNEHAPQPEQEKIQW